MLTPEREAEIRERWPKVPAREVAPTLLDEIDRLRGEVEQLTTMQRIDQQQCDDMTEHAGRMTAERDEARVVSDEAREGLSETRGRLRSQQGKHAAERALSDRLAEALRFYAKQRGLGSVLAGDGGMVARAALAAYDEREEK